MQFRVRKAMVTLCLIAYSAVGWTTEFYSARFSDVAIKGYDVVAYFEIGQATKGHSEFKVSFGGVDWYFSSAEYQALFQAHPDRYLPQYGGFCAYAMAEGKRVKVDPEVWTIVEGKLYLNYSKKVQKQWDADRQTFIERADIYWEDLMD